MHMYVLFLTKLMQQASHDRFLFQFAVEQEAKYWNLYFFIQRELAVSSDNEPHAFDLSNKQTA